MLGSVAMMTTIQFRQIVVPEGVIDLGVGQPHRSTSPTEILRRAAATCLVEGADDEFLQYGAEYGDGHHRLALAAFLAGAYGCDVDAEHLFTTNGNSQAIDFVCTTLTRPGDVIVVEDPTYFLARHIFADHGLRVVGVPVDEEGLRTDDLDATLADLHRRGTPARFVYTIPTYHNPTSVTMTAERRQHLVDLAERHDTVVVADEVYHLLHYTGPPPPPPLSAWVPSGRVLSLGTFSKIFTPGVRLGWIHAAPDLLAHFAASGLILSGGGLNPVPSALVTAAMRAGDLDTHLARLRTDYAQRVDLVDRALLEFMPRQVRWRRPSGGYFFWLRTPGIDTAELRRACTDVDVRDGALFGHSTELRDTLRISFALYTGDDLREGVRRLAGTLRRHAAFT